MNVEQVLRLFSHGGGNRAGRWRLKDGQQTYPPGVNESGVLVDPETYFWWLTQRSPGQPATDWTWAHLPADRPARR